MNDFKKEELCSLRDSRCYHMDDSFPSEDKLFMKLQSMIDNYHCNHESDGLIYPSNPPQNKCKKCGEFYR